MTGPSVRFFLFRYDSVWQVSAMNVLTLSDTDSAAMFGLSVPGVEARCRQRDVGKRALTAINSVTTRRPFA